MNDVTLDSRHPSEPAPAYLAQPGETIVLELKLVPNDKQQNLFHGKLI